MFAPRSRPSRKRTRRGGLFRLFRAVSPSGHALSRGGLPDSGFIGSRLKYAIDGLSFDGQLQTGIMGSWRPMKTLGLSGRWPCRSRSLVLSPRLGSLAVPGARPQSTDTGAPPAPSFFDSLLSELSDTGKENGRPGGSDEARLFSRYRGPILRHFARCFLVPSRSGCYRACFFYHAACLYHLNREPRSGSRGLMSRKKSSTNSTFEKR